MNPEDNLNGVPPQEQPKSPTPASPPVTPTPISPVPQPPITQTPIAPLDDTDNQADQTLQGQPQPTQPSAATGPNFGATPQQTPETLTSASQVQQKNKPPLFMRLLVVLLILGVIIGVAIAAYIFIPKL